MKLLKWIKNALEHLTEEPSAPIVEGPILEKTIFMETLESTLKISHDWAQDRITHLTDSDNTEDAFALLQEFEEWFDPDIQEHDIISMGVLTDEEDT